MNSKNQFSALTLIVVILLIPMLTMAQPDRRQSPKEILEGSRPNHQGKMLGQIPGLSDAQKEQMKIIHQQSTAQMVPLRNQINEQEARLQTLQTAKVADMKAINQGIDELSKLKAEGLKIRAKAHQDVRQVLTDEQRVIMDNHFQQSRSGSHGRHPGNKR